MYKLHVCIESTEAYFSKIENLENSVFSIKVNSGGEWGALNTYIFIHVQSAKDMISHIKVAKKRSRILATSL